MIELTRENFAREVEAAAQPVLVEFWAPWCGYCRRLAPVLARLEAARGDTLRIAQVNVDVQPELEYEQGLDAEVIPVLYLYQNGRHGEKLVAPGSQAELEAWLDAQLQAEKGAADGRETL